MFKFGHTYQIKGKMDKSGRGVYKNIMQGMKELDSENKKKSITLKQVYIYIYIYIEPGQMYTNSKRTGCSRDISQCVER